MTDSLRAEMEKRKMWPPKQELRGPCWEWLGSSNNRGYGQVTSGPHRRRQSHKVIFEAIHGAVPFPLQLDHLCRNTMCVNPWHLEPVTPKENVLRSPTSPTTIRANAASCIKGHVLAGYNLYVRPNGHRQCRDCKKTRDREWKARMKRCAPPTRGRE